MLFEGDTLEEVFSKAFGKPIGKYGRKPGRYGEPGSAGGKYGSRGKFGSKPISFGKQQEENPHASEDALARGRAETVRMVFDHMKRGRHNFRGDEFGCYALYDTATGLTRLKTGNSAGTGRPNSFTFSFSKRSSEIYAANGHSHPKETEDHRDPFGRGSSADNNRRNRVGSDQPLNHDDDALLPWGVVVVKIPGERGNRRPDPVIFWGQWTGQRYF